MGGEECLYEKTVFGELCGLTLKTSIFSVISFKTSQSYNEQLVCPQMSFMLVCIKTRDCLGIGIKKGSPRGLPFLELHLSLKKTK